MREVQARVRGGDGKDSLLSQHDFPLPTILRYFIQISRLSLTQTSQKTTGDESDLALIRIETVNDMLLEVFHVKQDLETMRDLLSSELY